MVDDGSDDAVISCTAKAYDVGVLRLSRQRGFCVAANAGVGLARADIVELLNDDTRVTEGWAEAALARFRDPNIAAVTPLVLREGAPYRIDSAGDDYHFFGIAHKRGHGELVNHSHLLARSVFGASGSSAFYRRDAFLAVGGLPEEFGAYFDDIDLSFRLRRAGYDIWYEPASCVFHRGSCSHGQPRGDLLAMQSRNEELVFWRNLPAWLLLLALPGHAAVLAGKAMLRLREGQLRPWLRGRLAAWRGLLLSGGLETPSIRRRHAREVSPLLLICNRELPPLVRRGGNRGCSRSWA